ncbi:MAG: molybdopterin biosynthesis protein [Chloroflexi bacterium]|nr:molybdopterin biosynthesis protein [Chloroflexota bacterium]MCI0576602.1 molybdopterin biosynthesis protein [Chloroflexota bacterium]MCI0647030.1 molybdopterin biosynthesis protein [Chloroflexota bacterium]MCI0730730.1 molybdopterin biosynthesis protein [Chloroflexota bacterium]
MNRKIYLEDIPLDEAWTAFTTALEVAGLWRPLPPRTIPLAEAGGRVTAGAVWARLSSPHYHASAMDGYAVRARDTEGATETNPVHLVLVEPGTEEPKVERPAQAVNTGHPLPLWANAVVMIEHTQPGQDAAGRPAIEIRAALPPWHHVRPMGEDMVATELVLPANHRLRPVDLGALAGAGHATVAVYRRPRVAIIPTGSELVTVEAAAQGLSPGQIIEYNSLVLAAQVEQWGGLASRLPIVPDSFEAIRAAVLKATPYHDLILVNAGSSAGSEDYTAHVVQSLGKLLVHGVAVRPGHPVILGMIERGEGERGRGGEELAGPTLETRRQGDTPTPLHNYTTTLLPIIGVPGYPVSAALTGEIFVQPLLARWQGQPTARPPAIQATLTRKIVSPTGDDDFVRVTVGKVGGRVTATPLSRGAGVITSLVRADGLVRIPRFSEGLDAGVPVTVQLYRSPAEIEQTIVVIGSHDLTLDLLAQFLAELHEGLRLASANVGSLGGLVALRRGEAHLAGAHLLDPQTGRYNDSYVERYLPGQAVALVTLAGREQGWIVPRGNPKGISGWADAANPEVEIVNRQRGAGTRVLLDYHLEQLGIRPETVQGYEREEYTHLAVAAAVASGAADAGLGVRAAARALGLDFVPLAHEQYDLVIPQVYYESDLLRPLLDLLHDPAFRAAVAALPGYDVRPMGQARKMGG